MKRFTAFASGLLFAFGLGISGMLQPEKIFGFLDFTGTWDPSLAIVMAGAVSVYALAQFFILKRARPLMATRFHLPEQRRIDGKLLSGAVIFGAGWGLSGICPGPAVVLMVTGRTSVFIFVAAMLVGAWLTRRSIRDITPPFPSHGPIV